MTALHPQIDFSHVLVELSVNRNDPCEVLRELISNSYDAKAKNIYYAPLQDCRGFVFFDDGTGLSTLEKRNGITPWEAFFSIGKSTKKKGDDIGYKCQGSKLCFASQRLLVATRDTSKNLSWHFLIIENPRSNLTVGFNIEPKSTNDISQTLSAFFSGKTAQTERALQAFSTPLGNVQVGTGTIIAIEQLDTEDFSKYFATSVNLEATYVYNYLRFSSCHGDVRSIKVSQGFSQAHVQQLARGLHTSDLHIFNGKSFKTVEFGFPYLPTLTEQNIKPPSQISRLRDGRFACRAAKAFSIGQARYSVVLAIDGNKRAHDDYKHLDRRGGPRSGVKLTDQRGAFVSVKGIKICKYFDIFSKIPDFEILGQGDSYTNYIFIIDGEFDLVTNRNALSKRAFDTLLDQSMISEIEKFLKNVAKSEKVFSELISRLKRESTETLLNEQIEILERSKARIRKRERFSIQTQNDESAVFLSPLPGEEYSVGVLYAMLGALVPTSHPLAGYWNKILTFSTQGIDSLAMHDRSANAPLADKNISAIEYKYEFSNSGPFNHSLAIVDKIIAWELNITKGKPVKDAYTCAGAIRKSVVQNFLWHIDGVETDDGSQYAQTIDVICLKDLITATFEKVSFRTATQDSE